MRIRTRQLSVIACLSFSLLAAAAESDPPAITPPREDTAMEAAKLVGDCPGGIAVLIAPRNPDLAVAIAERGNFVVHMLCEDTAACEELRQRLQAAGVYGEVSAGVLSKGRLPYAENLVNLVVVSSAEVLEKYDIPRAELLAVLAPLGTAYIARQDGPAGERFTKPWPAGIDEWTHYLHGPDGNPVARDSVVGPPTHYQWIADPLWQRCHETDSSISTLVTARGRLLAIVDEAPIGVAGEHDLPDKWSLVARDAFNGALLWKVPIRHWGWREWKNTWFNTRPGDIPLNIQKRLVAVGDRVYVTLGYRAPVSEIDARTGKILQTYAGTECTNEILCLDGVLLLSALDDKRVRLMALDAASGETLWRTSSTFRGTVTDYIKWKEMNGGGDPVDLDPSVNMATDGKHVALIDGAEIVGVDAQTGVEVWRAKFPLDPADINAGGIQTRGNLWIGTMIVSDGVVLHASPNQLAALDASSGKLLWSQPKKYLQHLWYEWKDVFVIDGLVWTWSAELDQGPLEGGLKKAQRSIWPRTVQGYDLHTGVVQKSVPLGNIFKTHHHHRCYRNKATERYILASRRGTEFVDLREGQHTVHNWVRGTCHVGMMPANGLHYAPPHPCQCYIEEKLNGMNALAPATSPANRPTAGPEPRLARGPAFGQTGGAAAGAEDWPTFRSDAQRSGAVQTTLPADARLLWRVPVGRRLSAPIAVGDRVFVALVDEHQVVCLDARDGGRLWEFAAGARVDSPPTYHGGSLVFGSADGCVYCLRAEDGRLAWRFRAAPEHRWMCAFGQLESAWPVSGSVLGQGELAYFAAGRSSQLDGGIELFGIDVATGEVRHQAKLAGPHYGVEDIEQNYGLPMGTLPDILQSDGSKIFMRSAAFTAALQPDRGLPELATKSGFLEGTYFKRVPWTLGEQSNYARLIVYDDRQSCFLRQFDSLRGLDPTVYFTPGKDGYLLFSQNRRGGIGNWSQRIRVRGRAMVLAKERLVLAGPPDIVDPEDPLGAFEGRKGGLLCVFDAGSGAKLSEHVLPFSPVFHGAAAAHGRLYLTDENGAVACYGVTSGGAAAGP